MRSVPKLFGRVRACALWQYCKACRRVADLPSCPVCRSQVTSKLRIFFPGEIPAAVVAAVPPPTVPVQEVQEPPRAVGILALSDVSHADTERFEHVEACEAWMMSYDAIDAMSVEDALDFLNVTLNEARVLKKNTGASTDISPFDVCRKSSRFARPT